MYINISLLISERHMISDLLCAKMNLLKSQMNSIKGLGNPGNCKDREAFAELQGELKMLASLAKKLNTAKSDIPAIYREYTDNEKLLEAFMAFEDTRKALRKPLTDRSRQMMLKKLDSLAQSDALKIDILNQSVEKGWNGVFPLAGSGKAQGKPEKEHSYDLDDFYQRALNSTPDFK